MSGKYKYTTQNDLKTDWDSTVNEGEEEEEEEEGGGEDYVAHQAAVGAAGNGLKVALKRVKRQEEDENVNEEAENTTQKSHPMKQNFSVTVGMNICRRRIYCNFLNVISAARLCGLTLRLWILARF
jgi:ABC-type lipoprotein release transport system permease subunit